MTNDEDQSLICSETWTQPPSHDTADPYAFVLGSGVTSQKSSLIKHSRLTNIYQSSLRQSKACGSRYVSIRPRCRATHTQTYKLSLQLIDVYQATEIMQVLTGWWFPNVNNTAAPYHIVHDKTCIIFFYMKIICHIIILHNHCSMMACWWILLHHAQHKEANQTCPEVVGQCLIN